MEERRFERITGALNIAYALLLFVTTVLFYALLPVTSIANNYAALVVRPAWVPINALSLATKLVGIAGLIGIYAKQRAATGPLMFLGFFLALASLVVQTAAISWEVVIWPAMLRDDPATPLLTQSLIYRDAGIAAFYGAFTLLFAAGHLIVGVASARARIFPRWAAITLAIGGPAYAILLAVPPFGAAGLAIYGVGVFGFGTALMKERSPSR